MAKLYFKYATMAAGKSTRLIEVASSYERQGKKVLVLTCDGSGKVTSRTGGEREAVNVFHDTDIKDLVRSDEYRIILVDESQFLSPENVQVLHDIVLGDKIPVMAFGLKDDFKKELFPGSAKLLALAESSDEIRAICAECEQKATCNMRIIDGVPVKEGPQVMIGREEKYKALCSSCYKKAFESAAVIA